MTRLPQIAAALLAAVTFSTPAAAEAVVIDRPATPVTVEFGQVEMVVSYAEVDEQFHVAVDYAHRSGTPQPGRLRMIFSDGDGARFGLPGLRPTLYSFSRQGDAVTVEATRPMELAETRGD